MIPDNSAGTWWQKISHSWKLIFLAVFLLITAVFSIGIISAKAQEESESEYNSADLANGLSGTNSAGSTANASASQVATNEATTCGLNPLCYVKAGLISFFTWAMLALTTLALRLMMFVLTFVITIASYNDYLKSSAVSIGWVLIRDLTNMVFVVALLLIAFGTILGLEKYEWKQMLFKLVGAAILVNFSRTICGLIIDAAQVVMITFVNGISATIGGNFIQAFSLDKIRSFSESGAAAGSAPITDEGVFIAAMAALFIAVTILVITGILLAMLVGRVIILWVLIVLSPVAFVLGVLPQTQKFAAEWWNQFTANVITGPILIFFLWLTLVTVGNGNINKEIIGNTGNSNLAQDGINFTSQAGIGAALQWDLLVNFCIAIGFLLVGIKVTQELRGFGSSMVGKAAEYGKKAVYHASGMSLARKGAMAGGKLALAGAKGVGMYTVGKPMQRVFETNKGKLVNWYKNKFEEPGLEKANDRLKTMYDKKNKTAGQRWRAGLAYHFSPFTPGRIKDKRVEDVKKTGESIEERLAKHTMSTSETPEGKRKTAEAERLKFKEETGPAFQEIGSLKERQRRDKISAILDKVEKDRTGGLSFDDYVKANGWDENEKEKKKLEEEIKNKQITELGRRVKVEQGKNDNDLNKDVGLAMIKEPDLEGAALDYRRRAKSVRNKGTAEVGDREMKKQTELALAIAKDAQLPPQEQRFEMAVRAAHNKEHEDQLASLTFREKTQRSVLLAKKMSKMFDEKEREEVVKSPDYRRLAASAASVMSANFKNGQEFGMTAFEGVLGELDPKGDKGLKEINADDFAGAKRSLLSAMSGFDVGKSEGDLEVAEKRVQDVYGKENYDIIMRNLDESMKKTAASGGVNVIGLINSKMDMETGRVSYRFRKTDKSSTDEAVKADVAAIKDDRKYWAEENNVSQVATLKDILGKDKDGKFAGVGGEQAISQMISVFGSMKRGNKLHSRLREEISGMVDERGNFSGTAEQKKQFVKLFGEFSRKSKEGATAFVSNVGSFAKALVHGEGDSVDVKAIREVMSEAKVKPSPEEDAPEGEGT